MIVQDGPERFHFKKGEAYVFKYSFRAKEGMRVATYSTRLGQLKGSSNGFLLEGDPMMQIAATNDGINVRFSNLEDEWINGIDNFLSWEDATGDWVHVQIRTTFGKSMQVKASQLLYRTISDKTFKCLLGTRCRGVGFHYYCKYSCL